MSSKVNIRSDADLDEWVDEEIESMQRAGTAPAVRAERAREMLAAAEYDGDHDGIAFNRRLIERLGEVAR